VAMSVSDRDKGRATPALPSSQNMTEIVKAGTRGPPRGRGRGRDRLDLRSFPHLISRRYCEKTWAVSPGAGSRLESPAQMFSAPTKGLRVAQRGILGRAMSHETVEIVRR